MISPGLSQAFRMSDMIFETTDDEEGMNYYWYCFI